ncbi:MAG: cytochrome c4 [Betaproteobacteria bacterium]|nr:cytochrome c4 [Betaproteobacteria bacterium]
MVAVGALVAGLLATGTVWATERIKTSAADPAGQRAMAEAGRKNAAFCANCHGEEGVSSQPGVPNLAGQNPAYLLDQIRKFGSGERKDPFMQGLIKVLKEEEREQLAAFYASRPASPASQADAALAARGRDLFVRQCQGCHGEQARGTDAYPRLAGQRATYLQTTLTNFRDQKGVRKSQPMSTVTAPLKNDDILALASYLTQLP